MEIDLDLWPLVAPLVPLLEEVERVEALAAGETAAGSPDANGQEETDHQGAEGAGQDDARMEGVDAP